MRDSAGAADGGSALRQGDARTAPAANAGMGGEGLMLIVQVVQILPKRSPASLVSTLGKYKEKQNLLPDPPKLPKEIERKQF